MKFTLSGVSSAAILAGLAGAMPAWAIDASQTIATSQLSGPQQAAAAAPVEQTAAPAAQAESADRVVVTGSFIQGTPEDAALPVEVYSAEELEEQGAPTALEFAKSLSIAGPTTGEAYYFSGAALTGSVNYNLRGLGSDKTLTLLNGRRMSQNTSNIPSAAIARTEILKDGAAVIYGADAVGGVVNFITRENFNGLEAKAQYKYIDGSDGDYGVSLLGGMGEGDTNILWSAEWEHRSRLSTMDRTFSSQPYWVNPAPWSTLTNLAGWTPRGALPATPTTANEFGSALASPVADFTASSCGAVGGVYINTFTCSYNYASYYNLVEENDIYRVFGQINSRINDNMDFHAEVAYGQVKSPQVFGSPAQPVIRGPARAQGATNQFYVPVTNPFVAEFAARSGWAANPLFAQTAGFTPTTYRAFAHGGNPYMGDGNGYGVPSKIDNQIWRVSAAITGELGESFGLLKNVGYDIGLTYNQSISYADSPDILGFRLQEAMNGFGGPNCSAADLDPVRYGTQNPAAAGKNGCLWWNPFATAFANQPNLGLNNPNYKAGAENPRDLAQWLFDDRATESVNSSLTLDAVFNTMTGVNLPGGEIGVAGGFQARQIEFREVVSSPLYNGNQPCDWPGQQPKNPTDPLFDGCTPDKPGPFVFFGTNVPDYADQQQYSLFGEMSLPVLDNLNFQAAVRREEFSGGLGATVYKVSGKWDAWGPLSFRASYGTNYAAPPAGIIPGNVNNGVNSYTKTGGAWLGAQTVTRSDIVPETATSWNVGAIWQSAGLAPDHDLQIILDYFDIETENEIRTLATVNDIAAVVFPGANSVSTLADCSNPLISRVTFNDTATSPGGTCVQGQTKAGDFASIRTDYGNGPGQATAGFDIQINYTLPLGPGDLSLGLTGTNTTEFQFTPLRLDGYQLNSGDDRLGTLNFATVANAASEWRANANANYKLGAHNFRMNVNYISGVLDERGPITPAGGRGLTTFGVDGKDWLSYDLFYVYDITDTLRLNVSMVNALDQDPPPSRQELGYDPRIGSPLGRTFEVGVKKTF
jgi:outer membrane receptor protein involved in Fe transport